MYHPAALKIQETSLPGVVILEPVVWSDERGSFMETYRDDVFRKFGITQQFLQDNHSTSRKGVLRGLHYQEPRSQGKLIRCIRGSLFDVAVDIRVGSPTFAKWFGLELSAENRLMLWIPPGFAHGFVALTDGVEMAYKCTDLYVHENDRSIFYADPSIGISWPVEQPLLSKKDAAAPHLKDAVVLPSYTLS